MKRVIPLLLMLVATGIFAQQPQNEKLLNTTDLYTSETESQEMASPNFSDTSTTEDASSLQLTVYGPGPYGQVDGRAQGGTLPYQWFQNGNLVASGTLSVLLQYPCSGGTLMVKDATGASQIEIITQWCR